MAETEKHGDPGMSRPVQFCIAISEEILGESAPVPIQGGLVKAMVLASGWGFNAVELQVRNPLKLDVDVIASAAAEAGLSIAAIGTGLEYTLNGLSLTSPDPDIRRLMLERYREHIDLADKLGATVFLGLCRATAPTEDSIGEYLDRLAKELIPLVDYAEGSNATLSLEPIVSGMTNLLNTTAETIEFLERPGLESILLLLDTYHMHFEDPDIPEAFRMARGRIGHIHISDSDRKYPGSGSIDYTAVGECLKEIGYDKAVSLEIPPDPDSRTAALRGLEWMRSVWIP